MTKKKVKNKVPSKRYKAYKISGDKLEFTKKTCPKCGIASILADHKNRLFCGKCMYMEMKKA